MNKGLIKKRIEEAIRRYATASSSKAYALIPTALTAGKLYEARVLSLVIEKLHDVEGLRVVLVNSSFIQLKASPGKIKTTDPHFKLLRNGQEFGELWTDVEFSTLSYARRGGFGGLTRGDLHELDILVSEPGITGYPPPDKIWLGVECKNTGYGKNFLREILGVRRELSYLQGDQPTHFNRWPRASVPASPASCLLVYSTDTDVIHYSSPGEVFGIDFFHEAI